MKVFAISIMATGLGLCCLMVTADEPAKHLSKSAQTGDAYTFKELSTLVFLPTRVEDRKGEAIYGLSAEEFVVEDNGVRQSVHIDEAPASSGLSLVVVVQCSRSSSLVFDKFKGLGTMIEAITGDGMHEVAVLSYDEVPHVLCGFSSDPSSTRHALERLKPCGYYHAVTIDAVHFAIGMLRHRETHYRRAILLISETRDHGSRSKLSDVVAELGVANTVIYSVTFSPFREETLQSLRSGNDPPPVDIRLQSQHVTERTASSPSEGIQNAGTERPPLVVLPAQLLLIVNALRQNTGAEVATLSGGEHMTFTNRRSFDQCLQRIANQIHNYYVLSYRPLGTPVFGLHKLQVTIAGRPDAVVQTRKNYWSVPIR